MDRLFGEEKKDATEEDSRTDERGRGSDCDGECEELVDLPPEIGIATDRIYQSEEDLQKDLEEAGAGDLKVILLDRKPRLVMPSDQHNLFTTLYVSHFTKKWGDWGSCTGTHKIHLPNGRSSYPDISYWGYPRCCKHQGTGILVPIDCVQGSMPDVIIQFSWQNKKSYEEKAINDIMIRGLEKDHGAPSTILPRLGYLIKVRFSKKRTLANAIKGSKTQDLEGLDIYRLPHGTTVADAHDTANSNAVLWRYVAGGPEIWITIAAQDLGITGFFNALLFREYKSKASVLYEDMKKEHIARQLDGLAT